MQASVTSDAALASIIAIYLVFTAISGARDYKKLAAATNPEQRVSFYRKWGAELILLTVGGVAALLFTGRGADLMAFPRALAPLHHFISQPIAAIVFWLCVSVFCVLMAVSTITVMRLAPNEANAARARRILTATPMLTRDRRERAWGTVMSLCAGAGEETVFRLLLPIVLISLTHSVMLAVLTSIAAFGIGHVYQGLAGVASTAAAGALMFGVYAATQSLWLVAAFHAIVDLRSVVHLGWLLQELERNGSGTGADDVADPAR